MQYKLPTTVSKLAFSQWEVKKSPDLESFTAPVCCLIAFRYGSKTRVSTMGNTAYQSGEHFPPFDLESKTNASLPTSGLLLALYSPPKLGSDAVSARCIYTTVLRPAPNPDKLSHPPRRWSGLQGEWTEQPNAHHHGTPSCTVRGGFDEVIWSYMRHHEYAYIC